MQNSLTFRFLEAVRQRTIIIVTPGSKIRDSLISMLQTASVPCHDELLSISLGHGDKYEVDYGKWCRKEISTEQATLIIDYLRETSLEMPDQVKIYDDTFQLLTPGSYIRNFVNE